MEMIGARNNHNSNFILHLATFNGNILFLQLLLSSFSNHHVASLYELQSFYTAVKWTKKFGKFSKLTAKNLLVFFNFSPLSHLFAKIQKKAKSTINKRELECNNDCMISIITIKKSILMVLKWLKSSSML